MTFSPGQPVVWRHVPRGGYFSRDRYYPVDGTIVRMAGSSVVIRVPLKDGRLVERRVKPENLRPRNARGSGHDQH